MGSTIALLTDFGLQDIYVGVMKGVIKKINPHVDFIDLTHDIPPQNISVASFILAHVINFIPDDTILLAIVDPGVGSKRNALAFCWEKGYLVCPNNGILTDFLIQNKPKNIYELSNNKYWLNPKISNTFHGRDIFAPVAGYLSIGLEIQNLGNPLTENDLITLNLPPLKVSATEIIGTIRYIDIFGNLITNIPEKILKNKSFYIQEKEQIIKFHKTYSNVNSGELLALIGSYGFLEVSVNQGNAQQILQKNYHDPICVKFIS